MVLTKADLIELLQNEVRILVHLADKLEPTMLEYRPSQKQRSALELLRYLSMMGPTLVAGLAGGGGFDPSAWTVAQKTAEARDFAQTRAAIAAQAANYAAQIDAIPDATFAEPLDLFGAKRTIGGHIVNLVVSGHAAYRTQLFLYLKSCGKLELNTMNLWGGMDAGKPSA